MLILPFPVIDPIAFEVGPIKIYWYGLSYLAGFLLGWQYALRIARRIPERIQSQTIDSFITWVILGTIIGGRLGYVLFYNPSYFLENPLDVIKLWHGGMSFHGGLIGIISVTLLFAARYRISTFLLGDLVVCVAPIGIFLGRIANFINAELFGRPSDVPWAMVFPTGGPLPRHPSQLYEAFLEGVVLFVVLALLARRGKILNRTGTLTGVFMIGYAIARSISEIFRGQTELTCCFLDTITTGQILSLPMLVGGLWLLWKAKPPSEVKP